MIMPYMLLCYFVTGCRPATFWTTRYKRMPRPVFKMRSSNRCSVRSLYKPLVAMATSALDYVEEIVVCKHSIVIVRLIPTALGSCICMTPGPLAHAYARCVGFRFMHMHSLAYAWTESLRFDRSPLSKRWRTDINTDNHICWLVYDVCLLRADENADGLSKK